MLGCLCGLAGPLLRECLGGGSGAELLASGAFVGAVVAGALAGAVLAGLRRQGAGLFFWLDSLGLALAACLGAMRGLTLGLGAAGALVLGLLAGLAPACCAIWPWVTPPAPWKSPGTPRPPLWAAC